VSGGGLRGLLDDYATGRRTPSEVAEEVLARVAALPAGPPVLLSCDAKRLRTEAQQSDERWRDGDAGALEGVPVVVKDNIGIAGFPTTGGGRAAVSPEPPYAPVGERLIAGGAIVYAKAHMTEYAMRPHGRSELLGDLPAPGAPGHVAGGSSSGSATSVRLGLCAVALGTDTAGSVRVPAAACGVVGYKPAHGELPIDGIIALSPTCDHVGVLAGRVGDVQPVMTALGAPIPAADPVAAGAPDVVLLDESTIGPLERGVCAAYERAAEVLRARTGAPPLGAGDLDHAEAAFDSIRSFEAWHVHANAFRQDPLAYGPEVRALLERFAKVTEGDYERGLRARERWREQFLVALGDSLLLVPSLRIGAPPAQGEEVEIDGRRVTLRDALIRFMLPFSFVGVPAIVVPAGPLPGGRTASVQLVARPGRERPLLAAATRLEQAFGTVVPTF
jgi:aspartyl-tRNA(Asn)/glutamyl-tRNA(Gln) amidotransferase subunit A